MVYIDPYEWTAQHCALLNAYLYRPYNLYTFLMNLLKTAKDIRNTYINQLVKNIFFAFDDCPTTLLRSFEGHTSLQFSIYIFM